jgi:hypothetical protein
MIIREAHFQNVSEVSNPAIVAVYLNAINIILHLVLSLHVAFLTEQEA